ncbi:hypothetical protein HBI88_117870 [Parastagonospora nodorum]|nr:hypothetical protein HBI97_145510 [Parastagonospora nodorum]KAH5804542.1 hypothetical protein HBI96_121460 [Parastagonospora nodorum]KAH5811676.1 hypothetical protein HBI94_151010 [Parastagonospora nodorum]KAH5824282.1 hypothetical protein HBI93_163520 [Parastagonospora nodorum]KAH5856017.1 hypothetical protein HBI91_157530 [Parastagonospora nodorum]
MTMKTFFVLSSAALFGLAHCSRQPLLQWDPDTVKDCVEWYNNADGESCEYVRNYFTITPEQFHEWNPSVSLDCTPWGWQSYCIVTQRRLDSLTTTTISSTPTTTTTTSATSASSLAPSPTAWEPLGCYAQNPERSILEQNMSPNGDASLSISACKNSCYLQAFTFAGTQEGNQCWCSNYVAGEWAKNSSDCNLPCSGNKAEVCGGKQVVNVFEALENTLSVIASSSSASTTFKSAATSARIQAAATSNGAMRNKALFGML